MDCVVDDGESLCGRDLMKKLDDDTAMHVLSYLTSAVDLARASAVSLSWRGFGKFVAPGISICIPSDLLSSQGSAGATIYGVFQTTILYDA